MARKRSGREPKRRTTKTVKQSQSPRGLRGVQGKQGKRGARGKQGRQGAPGVAAPNGEALARLTADLIEAQNELQVQFKRIAQLQAEVDELRADLRKT